MSSITSSSGASSDRRASSDSTASNSWTRSKPSPGGGGGRPGPLGRPGRGAGGGGGGARPGRARGGGRAPPGRAGAAAEVAEGVHERHVRQADVADLHAAAVEDADAAALGPGGQLVEQPGLADAGVAGDQPDRRPSALGPLQQGEQAVELLGPADEAGGGRGGHSGEYGPPSDSGASGRFHLRMRPPCM